MLIFALIRLSVTQKRALQKLARQREVAALVTQIAEAFINLPAELVGAELDRSFQQLLNFFNFDRISLFESSARMSRLRRLYSQSVAGVEPSPAAIDLRHLPWVASQIMMGNMILVSNLSQLPEEAGELKQILRDIGSRSLVVFPLKVAESSFVILTFETVRDERDWNPDLVQSLRTIADIIGSTLERKHAEEVLYGSLNRMNGIVESAMDAIIAVDSEQNVVVFNAAAEQMFCCTLEEALGQPLDRFIPARFRTQHHADVSSFAETGVTKRKMGTLGALWGLRTNGEEFPIEASISQAATESGKLLTVIIRDITERQKAAQQLRKSDELNASIIESLRSQVAVLGAKGIVVATTHCEPPFVPGTNNSLLDLSVGSNFFEVCRADAEAGNSNVKAAMDGVQAIYDGKRDYLELEYEYETSIEHRWMLMKVTPLKSLESGLVITHQDVTERKRHEQAIQELSGRLINAQEEERSRIARELHDDINQQLAVLAIELQQLAGFLPEDSPAARERIQALWEKTHGLSKDIQHLSHELHSTKLEYLGLVVAIRGLCTEFSEQYGVASDFQFRKVPSTLASDVSLSLFRVAQESLHNVAKHSHAKRVRVELIGGADKVTLRLSDDGIGFEPGASVHQTGLGMISMRERIRLVGGTLSVWSKPSMGTQVEAVISLARESAGKNSSRSGSGIGEAG
jgi:PAS domain S-box-containing protein